jgi:hypothetical protein
MILVAYFVVCITFYFLLRKNCFHDFQIVFIDFLEKSGLFKEEKQFLTEKKSVGISSAVRQTILATT